MILFSNGCSWTYGGGLNLDKHTNVRLSSVWPRHLGKLLNAERVVNLASGCGSNQRIFRTTVDWVLSCSKEELERTLAVIQFTEPSRYEHCVPRFEGDTDAWIKCKIDVVTRDTGGIDASLGIMEYNDHRLSLYTFEEGLYNSLAYCEALTNLFNKHNVKHYFWGNSFIRSDDPISDNLKKYFANNFNWLNDYNSWTYNRVSDGHPSLTGHKDIANIIHSLIKDQIK